MKIIIISDTHMPKKAKKLPEALLQSLIDTDYIIHLGDWQDESLFEELERFAPIEGVAGNVDSDSIIRRFGYSKIVTFFQYRIGLVHGHLGKGRTTEARAIDTFKEEHVHAIFFGHSHIPLFKTMNNTVLFNPGSPTDKRRQPNFSFGTMQLTEHEFRLEHVFFDSKV